MKKSDMDRKGRNSYSTSEPRHVTEFLSVSMKICIDWKRYLLLKVSKQTNVPTPVSGLGYLTSHLVCSRPRPRPVPRRHSLMRGAEGLWGCPLGRANVPRQLSFHLSVLALAFHNQLHKQPQKRLPGRGCKATTFRKSSNSRKSRAQATRSPGFLRERKRETTRGRY